MVKLGTIKDTINQHKKTKYMSTTVTLPKGITRFTYDNTSFDGFRVLIQSKGTQFRQYYSVKAYGSVARARKAAIYANKAARVHLAAAKLRHGKHMKTTIKRVKEILKPVI